MIRGVTHDVDRLGFAGQAFRVVAYYVGGAVDALDGALLDVELEVAEAFTTGDQMSAPISQCGFLNTGAKGE